MGEIALAVAQEDPEATRDNLIGGAIPSFPGGVDNVDAAIAIHIAQIKFTLAMEFVKGRIVDPTCFFNKDAIALVDEELEILALTKCR